MLKNLLKLSLFLAPVALFAQSKYDMGASEIVESYRNALKVTADKDATVGEEKVTLIVSVDNEDAVADIRALGGDVVDISNGVALVNIPVRNIEAMAALSAVRSIETGRQQQPMMYFARLSGIADAVLDGTGDGLSQAFTGKGVVTGLMDQGIDPNHVAFFNTDQTENRVKAVYTYMGTTNNGKPNGSYTTPDAIAGFRTDKSAWTHGTHVASIMAGGYNGTSNYGLSRRVYTDSPMPYYGLAHGSDIVMCGGYLYDTNIMDGVAKVIDYAKSVNQPAVVNLSLGSVTGPHDGSSSLSRYLAGKGEEAIIVVAAGNEGDANCAFNFNFNRLSTSVTTVMSVTDTSEWATAEFWYDTADAFGFEFLLCNISTGAQTTYALTETGRTVTINSSDATFGSAFASGSSVRMFANVDPNNNRYYVRVQMMIPRGSSSNTKLVPAVRITGKSGRKLASTITNGEFTNQGVSGAVAGTPTGSISDMATGENIIVAGAYTSSKSFTNMAGQSLSYQGATDNGDVCAFSSYGITYQGNKLPDLCAPGSVIVAAVNSYAYTAPTTSEYSAVTTFKNRKNYWSDMQGTSMACPFVAGSVALMLEADPTLDVNKARTILKETAIAPDASLSSDQQLQWGAGRIDVLAAVKKTLDEKAGVGAIFADDENNLIVTPIDGGYNIYVAGETNLVVMVYDAAGRTVAMASTDGNTVDVNTSSLRQGVYIIAAQGISQRHITKVIVK